MGNTCYSAISTGKSFTIIADTINIAGATNVLRTTESPNGTLPIVNTYIIEFCDFDTLQLLLAQI